MVEVKKSPVPLEDRMSWEALTDYTCNRIVAKNPKDFNKKKFKEWMMKREKIGYLFDHKLIYQAYKVTQALTEDRDRFIIFSGKEGEGKSTLAIQFCSWVDLNFNMKKICMDGDKFLDRLGEMDKGEAVVLDEGGLAFLGRQAMSKRNILILQTLMIMRQKNLLVALCIPDFHLLEAYAKYHRVHKLIHIKSRGHYIGYQGFGIKKIAKDGYKYHEVLNVRVPTRCFWDGYFRKKFPSTIDHIQYMSIKDDHINEFLKKNKSKEIIAEYVSTMDVAKKFGLSQDTIRNKINDGKLPGLRMGGKIMLPIEVMSRKNLFKK